MDPNYSKSRVENSGYTISFSGYLYFLLLYSVVWSVALAPWGGDAGCSVAVPGDVLKKLGGAPVDCVAYALAAHSFPETYELAPCECECGAVGRVQLLTADDLAGVGSFAEGFGLHHVDARATRTLLLQCGWLSVRQLVEYHSLVLMFKVLQDRKPVYIHYKYPPVLLEEPD